MEKKEFLADWIIDYLKNRNIVFRNLESAEKTKEFDVNAKLKGKEQKFITGITLEDSEKNLSDIKKDSQISIVTFNTKENLNFLIKNWKKFAEFRFLSIYFINPDSNLDKKWIIHPHTHSRICDEESLEMGLKTMFESVEPFIG